MRGINITIKVKILFVVAILLFVVSAGQLYFIESTQKQIITSEKDEQYSERVRVIIQTLKLEEESLNEMIETLKEAGRENKTRDQLYTLYKKEFQDRAITVLEKVYYNDSQSTIYPFILDKDGYLEMHPVLGRKSPDVKDLEFIKNALKMQNGQFDYIWKGTEKWMIFRTFEEWDWLIGYALTLESKYFAVAQFTILFRIVLGISFIIILFVIFLMLKALLHPLSSVEAKIKEISSGEGDLTNEILVKSKDEIGYLAGSFNSFIGQLKTIVNNIKTASKQTLEIRDNLAANTEETSSALTQISTNVSSMRNQISRLNENIIDSTTSIEEIDTNITSLSRQMQDQSAMAEETTASVTQMISSIGNVSRITEIKANSSKQLMETAREGGTQLKKQTIFSKRKLWRISIRLMKW